MDRDKGNPLGGVKTSANFWRRGAMYEGVRLVSLSSLIWCIKHKETSLFILTYLIATCLVIG
jgi:hypothetical protein